VPDLGLLFDVDGPIASPVSRTVRIASILDDLVTLAAAGVPIAFITGRSDAFIRERVIEPLLAVGLGDALRFPGARMFGVFEKGAVWAPVTANGLGSIEIDEAVALPGVFAAAVRELVASDFADAMFFDETKRAMVSVEQRTDVTSDYYVAQQTRFNAAVYTLAVEQGLGLSFGQQRSPDTAGLLPFRIDPTIISTDIESVRLDKDRGAERALEYLAFGGGFPQRLPDGRPLARRGIRRRTPRRSPRRRHPLPSLSDPHGGRPHPRRSRRPLPAPVGRRAGPRRLPPVTVVQEFHALRNIFLGETGLHPRKSCTTVEKWRAEARRTLPTANNPFCAGRLR
jgi:hypothetical protein